jgi:DNA-binding HxlR family transcriptional regulator
VEAEQHSEPLGERPGGNPPEFCPDFHAAVELIGRRWAGAILWTLADGPRYFAEIAKTIPGLSDRLLSQRLQEFETEGLVERTVHPGNPPRVSYALTAKGAELRPAIQAIGEWAKRWRALEI